VNRKAVVDNAEARQHWVPQFLLRGFHNGKEESVFVFDKVTGRSFSSPIRDVAFERGFYNIGGSADLDDVMFRVEDATAPIIQEIRDRKSTAFLDEDERIWLAGFTGLQWVRTKAFSERSQDMVRQIADAVSQRNGGELPRKIREQLGLTSPEPEHEKVLGTILGLARPVVEQLLGKSLILYRSDGSLPSWISDNPVVLNNTINPGDGIRGTLGVGVQGIEIYLPISTELTLAYMCPSIAMMYQALDSDAARVGFIHAHARPYLTALATGRGVMLSKENVQFQNSLQVGNAERFIYSAADNFDDARELLRDNPRMQSGPRYGRPR
jgi:hypothetical protein